METPVIVSKFITNITLSAILVTSFSSAHLLVKGAIAMYIVSHIASLIRISRIWDAPITFAVIAYCYAKVYFHTLSITDYFFIIPWLFAVFADLITIFLIRYWVLPRVFEEILVTFGPDYSEKASSLTWLKRGEYFSRLLYSTIVRWRFGSVGMEDRDDTIQSLV